MNLIDRNFSSWRVAFFVIGALLLAGCGSKKVDDTLDVVERLKSEDPLMRRAALAEVADRKEFSKEVVDLVFDMVRSDESADVRAAAVRTLRNSWNEGVDALPLLVEVSNTEQSPIVKFEIYGAMEHISDVKSGDVPPE